MPAYPDGLLIDKQYLPGMIVTTDNAKIWAYVSEVNAVLPFGLGVVRGTTTEHAPLSIPSKIGVTGTVKLPSTATDKFEGVTYRSTTYEIRDGYTKDVSGRLGYPARREISIVRYGVVAVFIDSAVDRGDPVFLRITASGSTGLVGCFRKDADTATAIAIPGASFLSKVSAPTAGQMKVGIIDLRSV